MTERTSLDFFSELNFILQFCPTNPAEAALRARFAKIGINAGKKFDPAALTPGMRQAYQDGMADAWKAFAEFKTTQLDTGLRSSADSFGTRAFLKDHYIDRMAGAVLGIYGNSKDEAIYPVYFVDADKQKLDGTHRYAMHFASGPIAAGQCVLVAHHVSAAGEPALCQCAQPLPDQFADAAKASSATPTAD